MRFRLIMGVCAIGLAQCFVSIDAAGQVPADVQVMRQEIDSLRAAQAAMQQELRELRALLQKTSAPAPVALPLVGAELSLEGAQVRGASRASVILVEYSDFQCPFCASYAATSYPQIVRDYVNADKLRYAFVNFPIEGLHPMAFREHVAAACAADEGRFWEMHDRLFANPKAADTMAIADHAAAIGLDRNRFRSCVESERHADAIRRAMSTGNAIGITGTPTFVIGVAGPDDKVKVAKVISGAKPYAVFKDAIDSVLASASARDEAVAISRPAITARGWDPGSQVGN